MTDPEPIDRTIRKIKRKWDADKEDWEILSGTDKDGNQDMLISQAPNTYWLKLRTITAQRAMGFGKEIRNLDDEIQHQQQESGTSAHRHRTDLEMLQLFGMAVPSKQDVIYTTGIQKIDPAAVHHQKEKIHEKDPDAEKLFRLYLQKRWEREQEMRENLYL